MNQKNYPQMNNQINVSSYNNQDVDNKSKQWQYQQTNQNILKTRNENELINPFNINNFYSNIDNEQQQINSNDINYNNPNKKQTDINKMINKYIQIKANESKPALQNFANTDNYNNRISSNLINNNDNFNQNNQNKNFNSNNANENPFYQKPRNIPIQINSNISNNTSQIPNNSRETMSLNNRNQASQLENKFFGNQKENILTKIKINNNNNNNNNNINNNFILNSSNNNLDSLNSSNNIVNNNFQNFNHINMQYNNNNNNINNNNHPEQQRSNTNINNFFLQKTKLLEEISSRQNKSKIITLMINAKEIIDCLRCMLKNYKKKKNFEHDVIDVCKFDDFIIFFSRDIQIFYALNFLKTEVNKFQVIWPESLKNKTFSIEYQFFSSILKYWKNQVIELKINLEIEEDGFIEIKDADRYTKFGTRAENVKFPFQFFNRGENRLKKFIQQPLAKFHEKFFNHENVKKLSKVRNLRLFFNNEILIIRNSHAEHMDDLFYFDPKEFIEFINIEKVFASLRKLEQTNDYIKVYYECVLNKDQFNFNDWVIEVDLKDFILSDLRSSDKGKDLISLDFEWTDLNKGFEAKICLFKTKRTEGEIYQVFYSQANANFHFADKIINSIKGTSDFTDTNLKNFMKNYKDPNQYEIKFLEYMRYSLSSQQMKDHRELMHRNLKQNVSQKQNLNRTLVKGNFANIINNLNNNNMIQNNRNRNNPSQTSIIKLNNSFEFSRVQFTKSNINNNNEEIKKKEEEEELLKNQTIEKFNYNLNVIGALSSNNSNNLNVDNKNNPFLYENKIGKTSNIHVKKNDLEVNKKFGNSVFSSNINSKNKPNEMQNNLFKNKEPQANNYNLKSNFPSGLIKNQNEVNHNNNNFNNLNINYNPFNNQNLNNQLVSNNQQQSSIFLSSKSNINQIQIKKEANNINKVSNQINNNNNVINKPTLFTYSNNLNGFSAINSNGFSNFIQSKSLQNPPNNQAGILNRTFDSIETLKNENANKSILESSFHKNIADLSVINRSLGSEFINPESDFNVNLASKLNKLIYREEVKTTKGFNENLNEQNIKNVDKRNKFTHIAAIDENEEENEASVVNNDPNAYFKVNQDLQNQQSKKNFVNENTNKFNNQLKNKNSKVNKLIKQIVNEDEIAEEEKEFKPYQNKFFNNDFNKNSNNSNLNEISSNNNVQNNINSHYNLYNLNKKNKDEHELNFFNNEDESLCIDYNKPKEQTLDQNNNNNNQNAFGVKKDSSITFIKKESLEKKTNKKDNKINQYFNPLEAEKPKLNNDPKCEIEVKIVEKNKEQNKNKKKKVNKTTIEKAKEQDTSFEIINKNNKSNLNMDQESSDIFDSMIIDKKTKKKKSNKNKKKKSENRSNSSKRSDGSRDGNEMDETGKTFEENADEDIIMKKPKKVNNKKKN